MKRIKMLLLANIFVFCMVMDTISDVFAVTNWPVELRDEIEWQYTYTERYAEGSGNISINIQFTIEIVNLEEMYITSRRDPIEHFLEGVTDTNWTYLWAGEGMLVTEPYRINYQGYPGKYNGSEFSLVMRSDIWAEYRDSFKNILDMTEDSEISFIYLMHGFGETTNYSIDGGFDATGYQIEYYINEGAGITEQHLHHQRTCRFFDSGILQEYRSQVILFYGLDEENYSWYFEEHIETPDQLDNNADDTLDFFDFTWLTSMDWSLALPILGICAMTGAFVIIFIRSRKEQA